LAALSLKKKVLFAGGIVLMILGVTLAVFAEPINEYLFVSGNENIMQTIMQPKQLSAVKDSITAYFGDSNRACTLQDLFQWQNSHLKYVNSFPFLFIRPSDPIGILKAGIGRCGEFSILFTAACIAEGYDARIATVTKTDYSTSPHGFCVVQINGSWTQVDSSCYTPSKLVINETSVYQKWGWWPLSEMGYSIFDFDGNNAINITSSFV
jgi:hypothetical protein